jgi:hypothetical protein
MWYHSVILGLFRPLVKAQGHYGAHLASDTEHLSAMAFIASIEQLKRLILMYTTMPRSASTSIWWHIALMYVANTVLRDANDAKWHAYFLLCLSGYKSISLCCNVVEGMIKGLLTISVDACRITSKEAYDLWSFFGCMFNDQRHLQRSIGVFVVDLDQAVNDPHTAQVDRLAEKFDDVSLFEAFTNPSSS